MASKIVVVDVDNTIAEHPNRGHYDWDEVASDEPVIPIIRIVNLLYSTRYFEVVLVTGRPERTRADTEAWLEKNSVHYHKLIMRGDDDKRKDYDLKKSVMKKLGLKDIWFVLEDRDRNVEALRGIGLQVLQVRDGGY